MPTTDSQFQMGYVNTIILADSTNPTNQFYGTTIFFTGTMGLLPLSSHGTPVAISGIEGFRNFLNLDGDIIYYGTQGDIAANTIDINTDLAPVDTQSILVSGVIVDYAVAVSGDIDDSLSGRLFVNASGTHLALPSGSAAGTCFGFLRVDATEFNISVTDLSSRIIYSSGNNITGIGLGGLFSYIDLISDGTNWIATKESDVAVATTGVA